MRPSAPCRRLAPLAAWAVAAVVGCNEYELTPDGDPTPVDEVCDEADAPELGGVGTNADCVREPLVGTFTPVVEWQWEQNPVHPGYDDIMTTPAVGDISGDGVPDVVFASFAGGAYTSAGTITAVAGNTGETLWSVAPGTYSSAGVALADLDADGLPEVCTAGTQYAVVCLDGGGNLKWAAGSELSYIGSPAVADLDGDGLAEVILGRQVFDHDGSVRWVGSGGLGYSLSFAADMDADPELEVVTGNTVYDTDGTILWTSAAYDGIPAVGDFDGDGLADVVTTGSGAVTLTGNDGVVRWSVGVPGGGGGGPPTVDDFDGDGAPEIGVAGAYYYSVLEGDGTTRWSMPVQDYSSSVTGSAVFDFEGDGAAEVVYADEVTLWVFDGSSGAVELALDGHASGTLFEYPLVVDVDADGSTEIVLASNDYAFDGFNGITVIGDANSSWAPSRPVWNQFAYTITNIEDDLSVPTTPTKNWLTWNNFRAGGTLEGPASWLPDVRVSIDACTDTCSEGDASVWATVSNEGLLAAEAVLVEVLAGDGTILQTTSVDRVESGERVAVGPFPFERKVWGPGLRVRVDGADTLEECDETDQMSERLAWPCESGP